MVESKRNDRLERVQVGRDKDIPLDSSILWFLAIYKDGNWDAETYLDPFEDDFKNNLINQIFCVWHGNWRTNLFLMDKNFILNHFKDKQKERSSKERKGKK